jgi:fibro-slime domain-containing protein
MYGSDSRQNKIFINGVDETVDAYCSNDGFLNIHMNWSGDLRIGGGSVDQPTNLPSPRYFDGVIDEVMFYSRAMTVSDFEDSPAGYKVESQWRDAVGNNIAPHMYRSDDTGLPACVTIADAAGTRGTNANGGVTSEDSFNQWFDDVPGLNLSKLHTITLTPDVDGTYSYIDDDFHPIDGLLQGDEGEVHNGNFTYHIRATFTYDRCGGDFVRFAGGDGAWIFINGDLALDAGGIGAPVLSQHVELDRLGLTDGESYTFDLFYAERDPVRSVFRLQTSLTLEPSGSSVVVSGAYD